MVNLNETYSDILDLTHKMINLKLHFESRLDDEEERELVTALFYDMLSVKIKAGRKLRDMKVTVDIKPELLEHKDIESLLSKGEESYKMICDIFNALPVAVIDELIN